MDFLGIVRDIGVRVETVFGEPFLVAFHLVLGDCLFVEIFIRKLSEPVTARLMAKNLPEIFGVVVDNRDVGYSPAVRPHVGCTGIFRGIQDHQFKRVSHREPTDPIYLIGILPDLAVIASDIGSRSELARKGRAAVKIPPVRLDRDRIHIEPVPE